MATTKTRLDKHLEDVCKATVRLMTNTDGLSDKDKDIMACKLFDECKGCPRDNNQSECRKGLYDWLMEEAED